MKRKALLIGYSGRDTLDGQLQGVSKDLENYKNYLLSLKGGAWYDEEVVTIEDTDFYTLQKNLIEIKSEENDVVFTVFSGHGEYDKYNNCRNIFIDANTEKPEKILYNLAPRQIIILDSCSGVREDSQIVNESRKQILLEKKYIDKRTLARKKYEEECLKCLPQLLKFYAAEKGTYANDTSEGGIYSLGLLKTLDFTDGDISIYGAHIKTDELIRSISDQKPDYDVPKLLKYLPGRIYV